MKSRQLSESADGQFSDTCEVELSKPGSGKAHEMQLMAAVH
jgi:hypothetical protein